MDKVIENCSLLIGNPYFALETEDYFNIFNVDNHNHPEIIFAMDAPMEANGNSDFSWMNTSRTIFGNPSWENRGSRETD